MKQLILLIYAVAGLLIAPCAWADPGSKLAIETTSSGYQLLFPAVAVCGRDVHVCSKDPAFCAGANMYAVPLGDNWPGGKDPTTIPTEGLAHGSVSQTGKVTIPVPRGQTGLWGEVLVNFLFVKGSISVTAVIPITPTREQQMGIVLHVVRPMRLPLLMS